MGNTVSETALNPAPTATAPTAVLGGPAPSVESAAPIGASGVALKKLQPGSPEYLAEVFTYHAPTPEQIPKYHAVREAARAFAEVIVANCPPSADRSDALRKIREAAMTANSAIALDGRA